MAGGGLSGYGLNFTGIPRKLPSFMMKLANEALDATFQSDEELMEYYPDKLIKKYQLTKDGDSWAYISSFEALLLRAFDNYTEMIELIAEPKNFLQAMKSMSNANILFNDAYDIRKEWNESTNDLSLYTVYDLSSAMCRIALKAAMRDREDEIEEHCDLSLIHI